jgi:DNA sulfur modification protein DndB
VGVKQIMTISGVLTRIEGDPYKQFGKDVMVTQLRFSHLESLFEIDQNVQREMDFRKRNEIREFILKTVEDGTFHFSPFIFSARGRIKQSDDSVWEVEPGAKLYILDGQHRFKALESSIRNLEQRKEFEEDTLSNYSAAAKIESNIKKLKSYPIAMQIYLDLTQQEERQLFTDINTERRDAHYGLIMQYDQRDQYTELTRNLAAQLESKLDIEMQLSRLTMQNSAVTSLTIIRRCLIAMFEGNLTVKTGDPYYRNCDPHKVFPIAMAFFESWLNLFPKQLGDRKKYVCGLSGIQMALAYTVYQLTQKHNLSHHEAIHKLQKLKRNCSWRHDDPLFSDLYDPASKRVKNHSRTSAIPKLAALFIDMIESNERL